MKPAPAPRRPARKRFGQHFLVQSDIAARIVETAQLSPAANVLEIGPGRGALTEVLLRAARRVRAVEIDRDLASELQARFAGDPRLEVIPGDVLRQSPAELLAGAARWTVVANLPYNISTPVLAQLLAVPERFDRLCVMLQHEVAQRVAARPGSENYGALSVFVQLVASARIAFTLGPGAFRPRPKVDSALVVIEPFVPTRCRPDQLAAVRGVVRAAFSARRKQLHNALRSLVADPRPALDAAGIDPRRRPETLSPHEFVLLARALEEQRSAPSD